MEYAVIAATLAIVGSRRLHYSVLGLALQSTLLGIWLITTGFRASADGTELVYAGFLTLLIKGLVVPFILYRCLARLPFRPKSGMMLNMRYSMALALGVVVATFWAVGKGPLHILAPGVSVMLLGVLVMITRAKTVSQAVGLMAVENGIALASLQLTGGLPQAVEFGVLFDAALAAGVMAFFSTKIAKTYGSLDTQELSDLRG